MKKIFILAIILLSGTATASAQEFLTINPDVRTAGMANASVATTGGAYSVFQNAASSLFSHNLFEVGFSYSPWMRDVKKGYDLMAFGGFYSFNHKHSISFGTRFYREPKLSPDDEDYPFIPKDENRHRSVPAAQRFGGSGLQLSDRPLSGSVGDGPLHPLLVRRTVHEQRPRVRCRGIRADSV